MSNGEFGGIETKLNNMSYKLDSMERKINDLESLMRQILSKVDNVDNAVSQLGL
jgi:archaellum component FlaC